MLIHFPKEWIVGVRSSGSYFYTFLFCFFFCRPGDSAPARKEGDIGGLSTPNYNKPQHRKGSANNFVSPNTVGLKSGTRHTEQFEITATPQHVILYTATTGPKKLSDTATPQIPMSPSVRCLKQRGVRKERVSCT